MLQTQLGLAGSCSSFRLLMFIARRKANMQRLTRQRDVKHVCCSAQHLCLLCSQLQMSGWISSRRCCCLSPPSVSGDPCLTKRQKHRGCVLNLLCCSQTAALMLKITDGGSDSRLQFHKMNARWHCCPQTCRENQAIRQQFCKCFIHLS